MPMFTSSIREFAAGMVVAALIVMALVLGREVLIPFALAIILTFILVPIVRKLTELGSPSELSVGLVMIGTVSLILALSIAFSAQVLTLTASLAGYKDNIAEKVKVVAGSGASDGMIRRAIASVELLQRELTRTAASTGIVQPPTAGVVVAEAKPGSANLVDQIAAVVKPITGMLLTLLFTGFLLAQHHDIRDRVVRLAGVDNITATTSALSDAGSRLSRMFLIQAALNTSYGIVVGVTLSLIGLPNAVLWGAATALLRFVPFIGAFLAAIPPIMLAAAVDPGWTMMIATVLVFAVGEPIVGHLIEPAVLGRGVGLSSLALVLAASFWTLIWGPVGLLLAAPLTIALVVLGQYIPGLQFVNVMLGSSPALKPEEEFYHRILSADTGAAAEQLEDAIETTTLSRAGDQMMLPALRIAARDYRYERLDQAQSATIRDTLTSVMDLVDAASNPKAVKTAEPIAGELLIIPARGPIDALAASVVATIVERETAFDCATTDQVSGLLAISTASGQSRDRTFDAILLSTVGGIEQQHMRLLVRRAEREFPGTRILVCDWAATDELSGSPAAGGKDRIPTLTSLGLMLEHLRIVQGKKADRTVANAIAAAAVPA